MRLTLGCGLPPGRRYLGVFEEDGEVGTVTYNSAVAVSHTGDTNETTLATVTIPGGLLQANSVVEIQSLWSQSGAGTASYNIYFGGTLYGGVSAISQNAFFNNSIYCANSITSQKGPPTELLDNGEFSGALITSAVNTANDVLIEFKGQNSDAGGTVTLEGYRIKLNGV